MNIRMSNIFMYIHLYKIPISPFVTILLIGAMYVPYVLYMDLLTYVYTVLIHDS